MAEFVPADLKEFRRQMKHEVKTLGDAETVIIVNDQGQTFLRVIANGDGCDVPISLADLRRLTKQFVKIKRIVSAVDPVELVQVVKNGQNRQTATYGADVVRDWFAKQSPSRKR